MSVMLPHDRRRLPGEALAALTPDEAAPPTDDDVLLAARLANHAGQRTLEGRR